MFEKEKMSEKILKEILNHDEDAKDASKIEIISPLSTTELFESQYDALVECVEKRRGVLQLPMGGGKSLISLSLARVISKLRESTYAEKASVDPLRPGDSQEKEPGELGGYLSNGITLIVCSKSMIGEWIKEIKKHFPNISYRYGKKKKVIHSPIYYEIYHKDYLDIKDATKFAPDSSSTSSSSSKSSEEQEQSGEEKSEANSSEKKINVNEDSSFSVSESEVDEKFFAKPVRKTLNFNNFIPDEDTNIVITTTETLAICYKKYYSQLNEYLIHRTPEMPPTITYHIPSDDEVYGFKNDFLFGQRFDAIFFDEIQNYCSFKTKTCKAACCINAVYRWGLSGTPIKEPTDNNIFGLYMMTGLPFTNQFVKTKEYLSNAKLFKGHSAYFVIRTPDQLTYIQIPEKEEIIERHGISPEESKFLDIFKAIFTNFYEKAEELKAKKEIGGLKGKEINKAMAKNRMSYLAALIYLRQSCICPKIAVDSIESNFERKQLKKKKMEEKEKALSRKKKVVDSDDSSDEEYETLKKKTSSKKSKLPSESKKASSYSETRRSLSASSASDIDEELKDLNIEEEVVLPPGVEENEKEFNVEIMERMQEEIDKFGLRDYVDNPENYYSSRIKEIFRIVKKYGPEDKIVIFSTSRQTITKLEELMDEETKVLEEERMNEKEKKKSIEIFDEPRPLFILGSSMSLDERIQLLEQFEESKNGILFLTYKIGSAGLNLQSANVMILVDFWWNVVESKQAIARVHRQGQTRKVKIHLLTANTGIENILFEKQKQKETIIEGQMKGAYKTPKKRKDAKTNIGAFMFGVIKEEEGNVKLLRALYPGKQSALPLQLQPAAGAKQPPV